MNPCRRASLLILSATLFTSALADAGPVLPPEDWTNGYVLANGIRIHYWRSGGDKPALIMAHGFSDDGLTWTNLAKELVDDYDVILPDARGHGHSDPPPKEDRAEAQREDLLAFIRALNLEKPILMGHSMGSASVAWLAATSPEVPRAVILEDPRLSSAARNRKTSSPEAQQKRMAQIVRRNNTSQSDLVALCMKNSPDWGQSECEFWALSKRLHHPYSALQKIGDQPSTATLFPKITAPTLILKADANGEERHQNEEIAALLKHGRIVHIDGAGHSVRRENKPLLLKALRKFLAELEH